MRSNHSKKTTRCFETTHFARRPRGGSDAVSKRVSAEGWRQRRRPSEWSLFQSGLSQSQRALFEYNTRGFRLSFFSPFFSLFLCLGFLGFKGVSVFRGRKSFFFIRGRKEARCCKARHTSHQRTATTPDATTTATTPDKKPTAEEEEKKKKKTIF